MSRETTFNYFLEELEIGEGMYLTASLELKASREWEICPTKGYKEEWWSVYDFDITDKVQLLTDSGAVAFAEPDVHWKDTIEKRLDYQQLTDYVNEIGN